MKPILSSVLLVVLFQMATAVGAQTNSPPTAKELEAITEHGRTLAEYDAAARHATDVVQARHAAEGGVRRYLARKTPEGWTVVFGQLSEKRDEFLIAYEATASSSTGKFSSIEYRPPQEDTNYFLRAALATDTALAVFGNPGRAYNVAAILGPQSQWWVYLVPAPTQVGVWPLGGDVRYLIAPDGMQIRETRILHKTIIESAVPTDATFGMHTHVLSDIPEDTDVFYVLTRQPQLPEYITTECCIYRVNTSGTINYLGPRDKLTKPPSK